jgi:hypothetical protein
MRSGRTLHEPAQSLAQDMIIFRVFPGHSFDCGALPGCGGDVSGNARRGGLIGDDQSARCLFQLPAAYERRPIELGLSEEAWHRSVVPAGWTPAGMPEHLGGAEWHWFQKRRGGQPARAARRRR